MQQAIQRQLGMGALPEKIRAQPLLHLTIATRQPVQAGVQTLYTVDEQQQVDLRRRTRYREGHWRVARQQAPQPGEQ